MGIDGVKDSLFDNQPMSPVGRLKMSYHSLLSSAVPSAKPATWLVATGAVNVLSKSFKYFEWKTLPKNAQNPCGTVLRG